MSRELETKPLVEIFYRMTTLDTQIELKQLKIDKLELELYQLKQELANMLPEYEKLRVEVVTRFPNLKKDEAFQPKKKIK